MNSFASSPYIVGLTVFHVPPLVLPVPLTTPMTPTYPLPPLSPPGIYLHESTIPLPSGCCCLHPAHDFQRVHCIQCVSCLQRDQRIHRGQCFQWDQCLQRLQWDHYLQPERRNQNIYCIPTSSVPFDSHFFSLHIELRPSVAAAVSTFRQRTTNSRTPQHSSRSTSTRYVPHHNSHCGCLGAPDGPMTN